MQSMYERVSVGQVFSHIRKSGRNDSLVMGLLAKATVATGARPTNSLILLASSGMLENARKAGGEERERERNVNKEA